MTKDSKTPVIPKKYLLSFILVTCLFSLWGFANDITNPLVAAFKDVFVINNAQSSWVQMAFYGGYGTMAIPAALFIRRFSYKSGIILGLSLYALGAMICVPAANMASFNLFLVALYILTFGLAFLETTANPYILSMGPAETATQRLNFAQSFNPIGSLTGMAVASFFILSNLQVEEFRTDYGAQAAKISVAEGTAEEKVEHHILPFFQAEQKDPVNDPVMKQYVEAFASSSDLLKKAADEVNASISTSTTGLERTIAESISKSFFNESALEPSLNQALADYKDGSLPTFMGKSHRELQDHDLNIVSTPYMIIGFVVLAVIVLFLINKLPQTANPEDAREDSSLSEILGRLSKNPLYLSGVVAQTFYVGAQIMCWTFIIQYAQENLGMDKATAQNHNIGAMVIFVCSRFICTFFLKFISPGALLATLAGAAMVTTLGAIYLEGMAGLYSLMAISACMSLMFPTIYGIALNGLGPDAKIASAGLILAIVGGAFMPRLQGGIMDMESFMGTTGVRGSFFLPFFCFIVIVVFALFTVKQHQLSKNSPSR
ncbi:MAG: MFS transporter [Verrucomicrobiota bacterium]